MSTGTVRMFVFLGGRAKRSVELGTGRESGGLRYDLLACYPPMPRYAACPALWSQVSAGILLGLASVLYRDLRHRGTYRNEPINERGAKNGL